MRLGSLHKEIYVAELSITATSVLKGSGADVTIGTIGETITAGQAVYLKAADSRYWKAQADGTAAEAAAVGIALNGGAAGQTVQVLTRGLITIGATVAAGVFYFVGPTAGGIGLSSDITSTHYVTKLGYATTTGILTIDVTATGLQLA